MEAIKITREEFKIKAALIGTEEHFVSGEAEKGIPQAMTATAIAAMLFAEMELMLFGIPDEIEGTPRRRRNRNGIST